MPPEIFTAIWIAALALLAAVITVVAVRTSRLKTAEMSIQKPVYDPDEARRAAQNLASVIRLQTVSHADVTARDYGQWLAFRKYLKKEYPLCAEHMELELVGGFSLLYKWASPDPQGDPLLFCGHIDVVPAKGDWQVPPFEGRVEDGYIWGRGALDCKHIVICLMETAESLIVRGFAPTRDIYFAFGHDEEIGGSEGAKNMAKIFAHRGLRFSMVLDEGSSLSDSTIPVGQPVAEIGVSEKGFMNVRLTARGRGGHSSRPPAHTALGVLSEALCRIEFKPRRARLTPLIKDNLMALSPWLSYGDRMRLANLWLFKRSVIKRLCRDPHTAALMRTTFAATMSSCGSAPNVLPDSAEAVINIRPLHGDSEKSILAYIDALTSDLGIELEVMRSEPPGNISDYGGDVFASLSETVKKVFPGAPVAVGLLCGGSDARSYEPYSDCVFRFSPFILTPEDENTIHGENEKVAVASLGAAIGFYRALIESLAGDGAEESEDTASAEPVEDMKDKKDNYNDEGKDSTEDAEPPEDGENDTTSESEDSVL